MHDLIEHMYIARYLRFNTALKNGVGLDPIFRLTKQRDFSVM